MIIDESAISAAALLSRIDELEKELQEKQELIDRWQIETYFKDNYPNAFK